MPEVSQSDWAAIARKRWPKAEVRGNGQQAVLCRCNGRTIVHLFDAFADAAKLKNIRCTNALRDWSHDYVKLFPEQPPLKPVVSSRLFNQLRD